MSETVKISYDYQPTRLCPFVAQCEFRGSAFCERSSLSFQKAEDDLLLAVRQLIAPVTIPEPKEVEV